MTAVLRTSAGANRERSEKEKPHLIAPGGFEPPFSDPKTDVLPLDEGAGRLNLSHPHRLNNVDRSLCSRDLGAVFLGDFRKVRRSIEYAENRRARSGHLSERSRASDVVARDILQGADDARRRPLSKSLRANWLIECQVESDIASNTVGVA